MDYVQILLSEAYTQHTYYSKKENINLYRIADDHDH